MKHLCTIGLMLLCGCSTSAEPRQADLLDEIAKRPPRQSRRDAEGRVSHSKYECFRLDEAVAALADVQRPWTVVGMIDLCHAEKDPTRKSHVLWILAASRDPRGAVLLGELLDALSDQPRPVKTAVIYGLLDCHVGHLVSGGSRVHIREVQGWWDKNKERLKQEAEALKTTEPQGGGYSSPAARSSKPTP